MATPLGHTLAGITIARRMGMRSPSAMVAASVAASLPDADVLAGLIFYRDAWRLHRQGTHTPGFALTAGAAAGLAGLITSGSGDGERDLIADAIAGAVLVASHVVLDRLPLPYASIRPGMPRRQLAVRTVRNWLFDGVVFGGLAWLVLRAGGGETASRDV